MRPSRLRSPRRWDGSTRLARTSSLPTDLVEERAATPAARWRLPALIGCICSVVFLLTAAFTATSGDVVSANVLSWQLATTGNAEFTSDTFPPLDQHEARNVWVIRTHDGREVIGRSGGAVAAAVPAYVLAGGPEFSILPGAVTAALLTALACLLLGLALREHMPERDAALAVFVLAFTTPVWSVAANGMWPHTVTVLGITGMAWSASKERWWLVGLFGGVLLWGRLHAAVIVAVVGVLVGWRRRDAWITAVVAMASASMLALYCGWTKAIYGSWNPMANFGSALGDEYAAGEGVNLTNILGFLISPDRGALVWTPLIIVMLPALRRTWPDLPDWSRALLIGGLCYAAVQALPDRFHGGDFFYGYRLMLEPVACAAPAFALSARNMGRVARTLSGPVVAIQFIAISAGAINNNLGLRAEDVWTSNSFIAAFGGNYALICVAFILGGLMGWLGRRIWLNPSLTRTPH